MLHENDMLFYEFTTVQVVVGVAADFEDREVNSQSPLPYNSLS